MLALLPNPKLEAYEDDLCQTTKDFITDLGEIFTYETEKGDIALIEFFFKRLHKERVMKHTIETLLPWKKYITERNIDFFNKNRTMFEGLPEDRMEYYAELITGKKRLSDDDLDACWRYLDTMIACAEGYQRIKAQEQHIGG